MFNTQKPQIWLQLKKILKPASLPWRTPNIPQPERSAASCSESAHHNIPVWVSLFPFPNTQHLNVFRTLMHKRPSSTSKHLGKYEHILPMPNWPKVNITCTQMEQPMAQQGKTNDRRTNQCHMGLLAARHHIWWEGEGDGSGVVVPLWCQLQEQGLWVRLFQSLRLQKQEGSPLSWD